MYISECRSMGIRVLTPDVNRSRTDFVALSPGEVPDDVTLPPGSPGAIAFGLSAVRNVGEALVELLLAERDENGPFVDFYDFAERVPEHVLNKRTVESLIKSGAFDNLGHTRRGLMMVFEQVIDSTLARRRERDQGVMSLFGDWNEQSVAEAGFNERVAIPTVEFDKSDRLRAEKEMLGLYVSDHPLFGVEAALRRRCEHSVTQLAELEDRAMVSVGGVVTGMARKYTRKGDQMATFVLEDLEGAIEVTVFPRTLAEEGHKLTDDAIVIVKGRVDRRDDARVSVNCQTIQVVTGLEAAAAPIRLRLGSHVLDDGRIATLKSILAEHPGGSAVLIELGPGKVLRLGDDYLVDVDRAVGELRVAFGHDAVSL